MYRGSHVRSVRRWSPFVLGFLLYLGKPSHHTFFVRSPAEAQLLDAREKAREAQDAAAVYAAPYELLAFILAGLHARQHAERCRL